MPHRHSVIHALAAIAALVCINTASAETEELNPAEASGVSSVSTSVEAIWQVRRLGFHFRSSDTYYNCQSLEHKVARILKAVGAHEKVAVQLRCLGGDFINNANMIISFAMPVEATAANVTVTTTYDSRQRLAARVSGKALPSANDIDRFPAAWTPVQFSRLPGLRLEPGDCDLLRGLSEQIFPHMAVQLTGSPLSCSTGVRSFARPKLDVAALIAVPPIAIAANGS